jgi:hypothetical protein
LPRVLLISLLALLLLVPATAEGSSKAPLRGTVAAKNPAAHLVSVKASRQAFSLRVPGSLSSIRLGQRVELRGSTLRAQGRRSTVLAQGVTITSSQPLSAKPSSKPSDDDEAGGDEIEIEGKLTSLSPVTVASSNRTVSCTSAGLSLAGLTVNDLVEMTCDRIGGAWVVREIHSEDADDDGVSGHDDDDDDDDRSGHDDDDDDSSGPGSGDDDEEDDD